MTTLSTPFLSCRIKLSKKTSVHTSELDKVKNRCLLWAKYLVQQLELEKNLPN